MSELTPAPQASAAIAHAERRLWLLDLMLRLCAALLAVAKSDQSCVAFLQWARATACAPIARVTGMVQRLQTETERQLCALRAEPAREAPPAPRMNAAPIRAWRTQPAVTLARAPREAPTTVEDPAAAAFRARVEAFEAFLDRQGPNAALPVHEAAGRLCGVLGLNPDWSRWLDDDWLAANLDLSRVSTISEAREGAEVHPSAPLCLPPPPHPSPPGPPPEEASFARPDDPELLKTYEPGFKELLAKRVFEIIDSDAYCDEEYTFLCGVLELRLATNEPYMWGGYIPLRGAVQRLCDKLRMMPDWKRWDGPNNKWVDDGFNARRRNAEADARLRAAGVDVGEPGKWQPPGWWRAPPPPPPTLIFKHFPPSP